MTVGLTNIAEAQSETLLLRTIAFIVLAALLLTLGLLASQHVLAAPSDVPFNVTSTVDAIDDSVGDGFCHTNPLGPAAGQCTLRAAIMEANVQTCPSVTIFVPSGTYTLTRPPAGPNGPDNGDLNLTAPPGGSDPLISIVGPGAGQARRPAESELAAGLKPRR